MKRRHLLAGAAALPLAGLAAQGNGANLHPSSAAAEDDPAVRAFHAWRQARERALPIENRWGEMTAGTPEYRTAFAEVMEHTSIERDLLEALGNVTATTAEGLHGQLAALVYMVGMCQTNSGGDFDPECYAIEHYGPPEREIDTRMAHALSRGLRQLGRTVTRS